MKIFCKCLLIILVISFTISDRSVAAAQSNPPTNAELIQTINNLLQILNSLQQQVLVQVQRNQASTNPTFTQPVIIEQTNNSILLMQQILATDPAVYPEGLTTGYFGALTRVALERFQTKFGLHVTGTFSNQTSHVLTVTLAAIPFATTNVTYLQSEAVGNKVVAARNAYLESLNQQVTSHTQLPPTPATLNPGRLISITAAKDYRRGVTTVEVRRGGTATQRFEVGLVNPDTQIINAIASTLNMSVAEVTSKLTFSQGSVDRLQTLLLTVERSDKMHIDVTYLDGSSEEFDITSTEIDFFVQNVYAGDYGRYLEDFNRNIDLARQGLPVPQVYDFVADVLGRSRVEIQAILEIDVEPYYGNQGPQTGV